MATFQDLWTLLQPGPEYDDYPIVLADDEFLPEHHGE